MGVFLCISKRQHFQYLNMYIKNEGYQLIPFIVTPTGFKPVTF